MIVFLGLTLALRTKEVLGRVRTLNGDVLVANRNHLSFLDHARVEAAPVIPDLQVDFAPVLVEVVRDLFVWILDVWISLLLLQTLALHLRLFRFHVELRSDVAVAH